MNLFGDDSEDYTNQAINAEQQGYQQSQQALSPYTQNAGSDFNKGRTSIFGLLNQYGELPNYNKNFWDYLSLSPEELVNKAMSGYSESPMMQEEMKYSESAMNNKLIQQGMGGSGENELADAEIGNVLGAQDMSRYLGQEMTALNTQEDILKQYNKYGETLAGMFQDLIGTESGASKQSSENAMRLGQEEGQSYNREAEDQSRNQNDFLNDLLRIPGDIFELDQIFKPTPKRL